jgi:uncharacterized protein YhaN
MRRRSVRTFAVVAVLAAVLLSGCAGTRSQTLPDDPRLIRNEIEEIGLDMRNTEEMLKGSRAQLQIEDSQELRNEIRRLEMELYELESQKRALEERLAELEAGGSS